jgi:hypothetical protein
MSRCDLLARAQGDAKLPFILVVVFFHAHSTQAAHGVAAHGVAAQGTYACHARLARTPGEGWPVCQGKEIFSFTSLISAMMSSCKYACGD